MLLCCSKVSYPQLHVVVCLFSRAVLFAYLETLTTQLSNENGDRTSSQQEYERFMRVIKQSKDELVAVGYDEFALETFYDVSFAIR